MIELVVVVALCAIISVTVISSFTSSASREVRSLDNTAHLVLSILDHAREDTLSSKNGTSFGVYFTSTTTTIFSGSSYVAGASTNRVTVLDSRVQATTSFSGGGKSIVFSALTGKSAQTGTVTLSLVSATTTTRVITVYSSGISELNTR